MKKTCLVFLVSALLLTSCTQKSQDPTTESSDIPVVTTTPVEVTMPEPTADELRTQIVQYKEEGNSEAVYETALKLTLLEPTDELAYIDAAWALFEMSKENYAEIDRLFAIGTENTDNISILSQWAEENQPDGSIAIPFAPDYQSLDQINTEGITTGNLTNAAKYVNNWWQGGLVTWQGDMVYLARPDEDFAIYKVRADGTDYKRVGEAYGNSLNVIGDWLYYINMHDGDKPYKMRTDGSMNTKLSDDECSFLSVSGDWMYYAGDRLYKMRTDGSEKTAITEDLTMFPCVANDWLYFSVKKMDGGLWRVSVEGGQPEQIATGFPFSYCVVDDWIYYVDQSNWYNLWRVHTDGTDAELFLPFDSRITAINVADGVLYINYNVSNEEQDGLVVGADIVAFDLETLDKKLSFQMDTEPICTGPNGMIYFFKFSEGMAWYSMDQNGEINKIE